MNLDNIVYVPQEEAEKGISFLRNGLPRESAPIETGNGKFSGYYSLTRNFNGKSLRLIYEPSGKKSFWFRHAFYLE
jgi:hypothetical protein